MYVRCQQYVLIYIDLIPSYAYGLCFIFLFYIQIFLVSGIHWPSPSHHLHRCKCTKSYLFRKFRTRWATSFYHWLQGCSGFQGHKARWGGQFTQTLWETIRRGGSNLRAVGNIAWCLGIWHSVDVSGWVYAIKLSRCARIEQTSSIANRTLRGVCWCDIAKMMK